MSILMGEPHAFRGVDESCISRPTPMPRLGPAMDIETSNEDNDEQQRKDLFW